MIERAFDIPFVADLALREKQIQQNYRPIIAVHKTESIPRRWVTDSPKESLPWFRKMSKNWQIPTLRRPNPRLSYPYMHNNHEDVVKKNSALVWENQHAV
jgi:hypothetical protein